MIDNKLKRYEIDSYDYEEVEEDDGEYVKYEDVKTYSKMLEALIKNFEIMYAVWNTVNTKGLSTDLENQINGLQALIEKATNQKIEDLTSCQ